MVARTELAEEAAESSGQKAEFYEARARTLLAAANTNGPGQADPGAEPAESKNG